MAAASANSLLYSSSSARNFSSRARKICNRPVISFCAVIKRKTSRSATRLSSFSFSSKILISAYWARIFSSPRVSFFSASSWIVFSLPIFSIARTASCKVVSSWVFRWSIKKLATNSLIFCKIVCSSISFANFSTSSQAIVRCSSFFSANSKRCNKRFSADNSPSRRPKFRNNSFFFERNARNCSSIAKSSRLFLSAWFDCSKTFLALVNSCSNRAASATGIFFSSLRTFCSFVKWAFSRRKYSW